MGDAYNHTVLLMAGLLLLAALPAAGATPLEGTISVTSSVTLAGSTQAAAEHGALHVHLDDVNPGEIRLTAEQITVTTEWIEGKTVRTPTGETVAVDDGRGEAQHTFQDAEMTLTGFEGSPEVLGIAAGEAEMTASGDEASRIDTIRDANITQVGASEDTTGTGEAPPGFWYRIAGPWLEIPDLDRAELAGSFDLFVNNVTMQIDSASGSWENWTGLREESENAAVSSYELRVTTLRVETGRLVVERPSAVDLLSESAHAQVDGEVTADSADGDLMGLDSRYVFDDAPLKMTGSGEMDLQAAPGSGETGGSIGEEVRDRVDLAPTGSFDVAEGPGVTVTPIDAAASDALPWTQIGLGALAVLAVGLFLVRDRVRAIVDTIRARVRERRVEAWMRAGDRLMAVRDYERAHGYYARVAKRYPEVAEAWYSKALVLTELGRHTDAADAYAEANALVGGDDPELVDLAATAAWRGGERDRARELFERLSVLDPMRLRERLSKPEMSDLDEQPWVDALFEPDEEGMAPYA